MGCAKNASSSRVSRDYCRKAKCWVMLLINAVVLDVSVNAVFLKASFRTQVKLILALASRQAIPIVNRYQFES